MGKFSGVLLASDFDDTLVPTSALRAQGLSVQRADRSGWFYPFLAVYGAGVHAGNYIYKQF